MGVDCTYHGSKHEPWQCPGTASKDDALVQLGFLRAWDKGLEYEAALDILEEYVRSNG